MVEEEMIQDEICKPRKPGHVAFPELRNMSSSLSLCNKMRARVSIADSPKALEKMSRAFKEMFPVYNAGCK